MQRVISVNGPTWCGKSGQAPILRGEGRDSRMTMP
jgi:hypothetical protein